MYITTCNYWSGYLTRNISSKIPVPFGKDNDEDPQLGNITNMLVYDIEDGKNVILNHFYQIHLSLFKKNGVKKYIIVESLDESFDTFLGKLLRKDIRITEKNDSYRLVQYYEETVGYFCMRISYILEQIRCSEKAKKYINESKKTCLLKKYKIFTVDVSDEC